jgi:hypothetical protein
MHANASFDYAVLRVVPRVDREEFVNAGVILFCRERKYLACKLQLDATRLRLLCPTIDITAVEGHLLALTHVCSGSPDGGAIAKLSQTERFHWLTAPRSTMVQSSAVRTGVCSPAGLSVDVYFNDDLKALLSAIVAQAIDPIPSNHNSVTAQCG